MWKAECFTYFCENMQHIFTFLLENVYLIFLKKKYVVFHLFPRKDNFSQFNLSTKIQVSTQHFPVVYETVKTCCFYIFYAIICTKWTARVPIYSCSVIMHTTRATQPLKWKENFITQLHEPDHARIILDFPISFTQRPDFLIWKECQ